jgi:hypothetical protein
VTIRGTWRISACTVCAIVFTQSCAAAADYYVATNSIPGGDGSSTNPWTSISTALANAGNGDTINIAAGLFTSDRLFITNALTLIGQDLYNSGLPPQERHVSRTVIRTPDTLNSQLVIVSNANVRLMNLTFEGDAAGDGVPTARSGAYTYFRPFTVSNCAFRNFQRAAIEVIEPQPAPAPGDGQSLRCYFGYNHIENIVSSNTALGIRAEFAQSDILSNSFASITGATAGAAVYIRKCHYTSGMADMLNVQGNSFSNCHFSIWAINFGTTNEKIRITGNTIEKGIIGIRVTDSLGQSIVTGNTIAVSGAYPSSNATPARGIWIHADTDPSIVTTDHQVAHNTVIGRNLTARGLVGESLPGDGSAGLLLAYDYPAATSNNGVWASVISNRIYGFDFNVRMEDGTNNVGRIIPRPVEASFRDNDIFMAWSYSIFTTGFLYMVDARTNWLGFYSLPTTLVSTNVDITGWTAGSPRYDTDGDGTPDDIDNDEDGDGILDTVEESIGTYGFMNDSDLDGHDDYQEYYLTGMNPTNWSSIFEFQSASYASTTSFSLTWSSVPGKTYLLYRTTNLMDGFGAAFTNVNAVAPSTVYADYTATNSHMYLYRVSVTN